MTMSRRWHLSVWILGVSGLLNGVAAFGQPPNPRLEKVFADWKKRQERVKTVRYRVQGEGIRIKGSYEGLVGRPGQPEKRTLPPRDITTSVKRTLLLDIPNNRYRREVEEQEYDIGTDRVYPRVHVCVFDGTVSKFFRPRERNTHPVTGMRESEPEVSVRKGHWEGAPFTMGYWPFFVGHGSVAWQRQNIVPGKLRVQPDREMVVLHGQGVHQNRPCLVLRTQARRAEYTSFDEFWVDPARDSAVVRQLLVTNGHAYVEFDIQYQQTTHGWLPRGWTTTQRNFGNGKTDYIERVVVEELTLDPPVSDRDFEIEEKPGMLIGEATFETPKPGENPLPEPTQHRLYRLADDGSRREVTFAGGVERRVISRWWWALGGVPVLGLGAWLIYRRRQGRRVGPTTS